MLAPTLRQSYGSLFPKECLSFVVTEVQLFDYPGNFLRASPYSNYNKGKKFCKEIAFFRVEKK